VGRLRGRSHRRAVQERAPCPTPFPAFESLLTAGHSAAPTARPFPTGGTPAAPRAAGSWMRPAAWPPASPGTPARPAAETALRGGPGQRPDGPCPRRRRRLRRRCFLSLRRAGRSGACSWREAMPSPTTTSAAAASPSSTRAPPGPTWSPFLRTTYAWTCACSSWARLPPESRPPSPSRMMTSPPTTPAQWRRPSALVPVRPAQRARCGTFGPLHGPSASWRSVPTTLGRPCRGPGVGAQPRHRPAPDARPPSRSARRQLRALRARRRPGAGATYATPLLVWPRSAAQVLRRRPLPRRHRRHPAPAPITGTPPLRPSLTGLTFYPPGQQRLSLQYGVYGLQLTTVYFDVTVVPPAPPLARRREHPAPLAVILDASHPATSLASARAGPTQTQPPAPDPLR